MAKRSQDKTPPGGFGQVFKACIDSERPANAHISAFINQLASKANVGERTIWRLLDSPDWPSAETLKKLSGPMPSVGTLTLASASMGAPWEIVWDHQKRLPKKSTITILAAAENPKALDDKGMASSLAHNILERDYKYVFLFPPYPVKNLAQIKHSLTTMVSSVFTFPKDGAQNSEISLTDEDFKKQLTKLEKHISFFRTIASPKNWELWGSAPRYAVLYNIRAKSVEKFPQYGMCWHSGTTGYAAPIDQLAPQEFSGWTYLEMAKSDQLIECLEDPNSEILDSNDFAAWPIPGEP